MGEASRLPFVTELELIRLGALSPARAETLAAELSRHLGVACRLSDGTAVPASALAGREQQDADALLASLEARLRPDGVVALGVTAEDLALPIFTFVFGRARAGGRAAVVSLARLDPSFYGLPADEPLLLQRAVREARHELGHVASLAHCDQAACLMRFAGSVEKADLRGSDFCPECWERLPGWLRGR
jgi:archaemetzincin